MSVRAILRAAPVVTSAELDDYEDVRHGEMFRADALRPRPGREVSDIPILVDHQKDSTPVGHVTALRTDDYWETGGRWLWVHAEITHPPGWLDRATPVSISFAAFDRRTPSWGLAKWDVIHKGLLSEVSLLSPGKEPAHPRARVVWIGEPEKPKPSSAAVRASSDRAAAGEVVGDWTGHRPEELAWAEEARKRGSIVRFGSGQVLAVR